jgi:vacuolar protein 8
MASSRPGSPSSSVGDGTLHSGRSRSRLSRHSYQDTEEGQGEIQLLARRILDFTDGDGEGDHDGDAYVGSQVSGVSHGGMGDREGTTPGRTASGVALGQGPEHEDLRKSVRDAFVHGSYRSNR